MSDRWVFRPFAERDLVARILADEVLLGLERAIEDKNCASLVVSGGGTPLGLFQHLRKADIPWSKVTVIPTDERWVSVNHQNSNEAFIRRELLKDAAEAAYFISFYRTDIAAEDQCKRLDVTFNEYDQPFDVVVAGMGEDGHIASVFSAPESRAEESFQTKNNCVTCRHPLNHSVRISLTLFRLSSARGINILFFGHAKKKAFDAAMTADSTGYLPVRSFINQCSTPVSVYWAP